MEEVALGVLHTCARTRDGADCDVDGDLVPCARRPIPFAASVLDVGAGARSTCALREDGGVVCRGGEWPSDPVAPR